MSRVSRSPSGMARVILPLAIRTVQVVWITTTWRQLCLGPCSIHLKYSHYSNTQHALISRDQRQKMHRLVGPVHGSASAAVCLDAVSALALKRSAVCLDAVSALALKRADSVVSCAGSTKNPLIS